MQHCSKQNVTAKPLHIFCSTAANIYAVPLQHIYSGTAKKTCSSRKIRLEIESETYLQTEFRTVAIDVPVSCRFDGHRAGQEERITGFQTERELGIIQIMSPIPTVHIDIGTQIHANLVEIITSTYTQRIDIEVRPSGIPSSPSMHQQGDVVEQESTSLGFKAKTCLVGSRVMRKLPNR